MEQKRKKLDILVLSDIHLGTYGCHAKELLHYLKSIKPKTVILNGDIIDIWQFSKRYWPKSHMKVVKHLMHWMSKGVKIYYVPGNHDEMLRKFTGWQLGSLKIVNKVVLDLPNDGKAWFFHGDVFDVTMQHSKWLAKLGAVGYDTLILINRLVNFISENVFGKGKISLSKKIKNSVKSAVNQYKYVVCGHIHQPEMRSIQNQEGEIMYLNSGDWIENLTSLEYVNGAWSIYRFNHEQWKQDTENEEEEPDNQQLFDSLLEEFNLMKQ
jgi:UDP-2,3-diacylglucosamine pyrophosphatase LpxH